MDADIADQIARQLGSRTNQAAERQIQAYRTQINAFDEQIAQWAQRITDNRMRAREEDQRLQVALEAAKDRSYADHLVEEWTQLRKHPRLVSAEFNDEGSVLTLTTTDDIRLHREDSDETRWLGTFRIELNLANGAIKLHNLNTRRGGRDHPHVVNGSPCFGSDEAVFSELMSAGSLFLLYEMLLQYLEKLNLADSYGAFGAYWFDREDVRPEGAPAPEPPEVEAMEVFDFAQEYGVEAEFIVVGEGRRGRIIDNDGGEGDCRVRWVDGIGPDEWRGGESEESNRGSRLMVVPAEVAVMA